MALRRQVSRQAMGGKAQSMGSAGFQTILLSPRAGGATTPRPGASPDGAEAALSPSGSSLSLSSPTHKASPGSVSSHTSSTATPTPIDALLKEHLKNLSGQGYGIDDATVEQLYDFAHATTARVGRLTLDDIVEISLDMKPEDFDAACIAFKLPRGLKNVIKLCGHIKVLSGTTRDLRSKHQSRESTLLSQVMELQLALGASDASVRELTDTLQDTHEKLNEAVLRAASAEGALSDTTQRLDEVEANLTHRLAEARAQALAADRELSTATEYMRSVFSRNSPATSGTTLANSAVDGPEIGLASAEVRTLAGEVQRRLATAHARAADAELEQHAMQSTLHKLEGALAALTREHQRLQSDFEALQTTESITQTELRHQVSERLLLEDSFTSLQVANSAMQREYRELVSEMQSLESGLAVAQADNTRLLSEMALHTTHSDTLQQMQTELAVALTKCSSLESQLASATLECRELSASRSEASTALATLLAEHAAAQAEVARLGAALTVTLESLAAESASHTEWREQSQSQSEEVRRLLALVSQLSIDRTADAVAATQREDALLQQATAAASQLDAVKRQLATEQQEHTLSAAARQELEATLAIRDAEAATQATRFLATEGSLQASQTHLGVTAAQLESTRAEWYAVRDALLTAQATEAALQQQLSASVHQISELEAALAAGKLELAEEILRVRAASDVNAELHAQFVLRGEEMEALEEQVTALSSEALLQADARILATQQIKELRELVASKDATILQLETTVGALQNGVQASIDRAAGLGSTTSSLTVPQDVKAGMIQQLHATIDNLKGEVATRCASQATLAHQLETMQAEVTMQHARLLELEGTCATQNSDLQLLQSTIDQANAELVARGSALDAANGQFSDVTAQLADLRTEIIAQAALLQQLTATNTTLATDFDSKGEVTAALERSNTELQSRVHEQTTALKQVETARDQLIADIRTKVEAADATEAIAAGLRDQLSEQCTLKVALEATVSTLRSEVHAKDEHISELETTASRLHEEVTSQAALLQCLTASNSQLASDLALATARLSGVEITTASVCEQLAQKAERVHQLEMQVTAATEGLRLSQAHVTQLLPLEALYAAAKTHGEQVEAALAVATSTIETWQAELFARNKQLQEAASSETNAHAEHSALRRRCFELEHGLSAASAEVAAGKARVAQLEGEVQAANTQIVELTAQHTTLQANEQELASELNAERARTTQLSTLNSNLDGELAKLQSLEVSVRNDCMDWERQMRQSQLELSEAQSASAAAASKLATATARVIELEASEASLRLSLAEATRKCEQAEATVTSLTDTLASMRQNLTGTAADWEARARKAADDVAFVEGQLDALRAKHSTVVARLNEVETSEAALRRSVLEASDSTASSTQALAAAQAQIAGLRDEMAYATRAGQSQQAEIDALQGEVRDAAARLAESHATLAGREHALAAATARVGALEGDVPALRARVVSLETEITQLLARLNEANVAARAALDRTLAADAAAGLAAREVQHAQHARDTARDEVAFLSAHNVALEERLKMLEAGSKDWQESSTTLHAKVKELQESLRVAVHGEAEAKAQVDGLETRVSELVVKLLEATERLRETQGNLDTIHLESRTLQLNTQRHDSRVGAAERAVVECRTSVKDATDRLQASEDSLGGLRLRLHNSYERLAILLDNPDPTSTLFVRTLFDVTTNYREAVERAVVTEQILSEVRWKLSSLSA